MAADTQRAAQAGLTAALVDALRRIWPLLDLDRLKATMPAWQQAVAAVVTQLSAASGTIAAQGYLEDRSAAGIKGAMRVPPGPVPAAEQVATVLDWATRDLWSRTLTPQTVSTVQATVEGAAQKLVTDTGRDTVIGAVKADRKARGYARVARPNCCAFCRMLASRGPVYKTAETAGEVEASTVYGGDAHGAVNRYHDHCHCQVVPVFGAWEPPAYARGWEQQWRDVTKGLSGNAARIAWRRHVEGRNT